MCFPVNSVKFLGIPILKDICERPLLNYNNKAKVTCCTGRKVIDTEQSPEGLSDTSQTSKM